MASFQKFNAFVEALAEKKHNLGSDQITVALCNAANAPVSTDAVLADLTQISYTNLSSRSAVTASSAQSGGTYKLVLNDLILTASGTVDTFRYIVLYNSTSADNSLIGFYDYGSDVTLTTGQTVTLDFDGSAGTLTIQ